jgi:adenine-specific DNA-methyltransferase
MMDYAETITAERVKKVSAGYSYKGEKEEVIYSKKLTIKNIINADKIIEEANLIASESTQLYTKIGKPKIEDNCIKVIGTVEYNGLMEGTGGSFNYYELGKPIFKGAYLNEDVGENRIREYIYYTETKQHLERENVPEHRYLLDTLNNTGYYFYYEKDRLTTLSLETLNVVTENAEQYLIYADHCLLEKDYMLAKNIIFKKIPRDIKRF